MVKHLDKNRIKECRYFISAISAVALNMPVPTPDDNLDWQFIYSLSEANNGTPLLFKALESSDVLPPDDIYKKLQSQSTLYTVQDTNQMYELTAVMEDFEAEGVYFCPLKGFAIKSDYPQSDFRIMSDCDILFKEEQIEQVKKIFEKHGFTFTFFDNDNQYHFEKKPFVFIEMHTSLVNHRDEMYDYFVGIWKRLKPADNKKYWLKMPCEDFYIFLLEHGANHYVQGGMGIRILLDIFLYKTKYLNKFDKEYLSAQLKTTGLDVFEKKLNSIGIKWFINNNFENISLLEEFIILSSTLGRTSVGYANLSLNHKREMENQNKKPSIVRFILKSTFPSKSQMSIHYPYLNKAPVLLPISWIQMWFRRLFIEKNVHFKNGIKNRINYITPEDEKYINALNREVGFKEK